MSFSRRRLPHDYPERRWLFVTYCLAGSLPVGRFAPAGKMTSGEAFVCMDRFLDGARMGPMFLRRADVAGLVERSLYFGQEQGWYLLGGYCAMANHVHLVVWPEISPCRFLRSLKGFTAREANLLLGRTGMPFWQAESYDHWVRDEREFWRILRYVENNPVKAGIVERAEEYRWSSAWKERVS